jgi:hypothetical protein
MKIDKIEKKIKDLYELVLDGEIDPLDVIFLLKQIEKKSKEYKTKIEGMAIEELSKYGKDGYNIEGYNINIKKSAGRWSFDHISEIKELENKLKDLKDKHKSAYKQLDKNITSIGEGGVVVTPAKYKEGKEIIIMTKNDKS